MIIIKSTDGDLNLSPNFGYKWKYIINAMDFWLTAVFSIIYCLKVYFPDS